MRCLAPLLALGFVACSLDTTEPGPLRPENALDVNVDFCFGDQPNWIAIKNEGQPWAVITGNSQQRYILAVSPKVGVAYGRTFLLGPGVVSSTIRVLYVTADELAQATCGKLIGSKVVYANISGLGNNDVVLAAISGATGSNDPSYRFGTLTQVRIDGVAAGAGDMLASLLAQNATRPKYILRHGIDVPSGSLIGALDFDSNEATFTDRFPITIGGGATADVFATFISSRGTVQELGETSVPGGAGNYMALPQARLATGDLHRQTVAVTDGRRTAVYASTLGPLNVSLGPVLSTPTLATTQLDPVVLMRASLPSQPEYPSFAAATFYQGSSHVIGVIVSAAYLGATPAQWEIEVPHLAFLVDDLQLRQNAETQWVVEAWNSSAGLFFGHQGATEGSVVRCAIATSSSTLMRRGCRSPLQLAAPSFSLEVGALLSP